MKNKYTYILLIFFSNLFASANNLGQELPLYSLLPFCGILFSIAAAPLVAPLFWHNNYGKISIFWSLLFIVPFYIWKGINVVLSELAHVLILEYIPFVVLLFSLYTISGGIRIRGNFKGTPLVNTLLILMGTIFASWIGTTGAAMLLVRPLIRANKFRKYKVHTIIFFIFLVANIGGSLTPLGDPPLFLGYLNGVDFFWTTKMLFLPMILLVVMLIFIYIILDIYFYSKENIKENNEILDCESFGIEGKLNFILIIGVLISVLLSGMWSPKYLNFTMFDTNIYIQNIIRDLLLVMLAILSLKITEPQIRIDNHFTWFPILEVVKLFAGIFITIIPAIAILKAGNEGVLKFLIATVSDHSGNPINSMYFWLTGILSAFLDNAPTYLIFFNIASIDAPSGMSSAIYMMEHIPITLLAISCGAVFMGAMTYIGNAPNYMIKSIVEENNIKMPSFIGYMVLSTLILIPLFMIISLILF